jgi:hypothetical protein
MSEKSREDVLREAGLSPDELAQVREALAKPFTNFKSDMKSRVQDRADRNKKRDANQRDVYRAVSLRDKYRCRCCGRACNPSAASMLNRAHHHHVTFRSKGGVNTTQNVALLCAQCHHEIHMHRLTVDGNADGVLVFATERHTLTSEPPK